MASRLDTMGPTRLLGRMRYQRLPTLNNNAANLNLNTWTLLSDVLGVNDTDGDTIQAIRFENTGTDTLSYSLSKRAYLDSNVSYDLPHSKM